MNTFAFETQPKNVIKKNAKTKCFLFIVLNVNKKTKMLCFTENFYKKNQMLLTSLLPIITPKHRC